ncbi:GNVR domain-containing protein [Variovorax sp. RHLX14]|uniref:GNVR domain-containing protein n=1 Tax=Variovorax sp. RHLX14 TaxID=1259731 RepID=UPI003F46DC53
MSRLPIASSVDDQRRPLPSSRPGDVIAFSNDDEPGFSEYRDIVLAHKWLIAGVTGLVLLIGLAYIVIATPIYRANLLIQIEDSAPESKSFLTETTGLGELKTTASGEIQVLGSRMILGAAVDQVGLQIDARPRLIPVIGDWLTRGATGLSNPGFLGVDGYVSGLERIAVTRFNVPSKYEDVQPFKITVLPEGKYSISHELLDAPLQGSVGVPMRHMSPDGEILIDISELYGKVGADFLISVSSRLNSIENLQSRLLMSEQGRQSNVVNVTLEDSDPVRLGLVLDAIAERYLGQNVQRKSEEAEKTLAFLSAQLPIFERQLKASEDAFARFRNQNGTIAFDEEAKVWLRSAADLQSNLLNLQQSRLDLRRTTNETHPKIQTLNQQIAAVQSELMLINKKITAMPNVQRDALRLERDVRANSAQYQSMQNNALQMRLVSEGKIGNVRILDRAVVSKAPVKPQRKLILAFTLVTGLLLGLAAAVICARMRNGVRNANEVSMATGLELFGSVPQSPEQLKLIDKNGQTVSGKLLTDTYPYAPSSESLRSIRVALRRTVNAASNNRVLITGATARIGKSFIASNLAALMAQTGNRVLLINADMRKDDETDAFGLMRSPGLSELVSGSVPIAIAIQSNVRPNLDVLTAGKFDGFSADMFEAKPFHEVLDAVSRMYDHIIIDSAPILVAADAIAIAPLCGSVLLVVRKDATETSEVTESIRRIAQASGAVDGFIFNGSLQAKPRPSKASYTQQAARSSTS